MDIKVENLKKAINLYALSLTKNNRDNDIKAELDNLVASNNMNFDAALNNVSYSTRYYSIPKSDHYGNRLLQAAIQRLNPSFIYCNYYHKAISILMTGTNHYVLNYLLLYFKDKHNDMQIVNIYDLLNTKEQ